MQKFIRRETITRVWIRTRQAEVNIIFCDFKTDSNSLKHSGNYTNRVI